MTVQYLYNIPAATEAFLPRIQNRINVETWKKNFTANFFNYKNMYVYENVFKMCVQCPFAAVSYLKVPIILAYF